MSVAFIVASSLALLVLHDHIDGSDAVPTATAARALWFNATDE